MAWGFVSNNFSADEVSEVRVSTSFLMCSDESLFGLIYFYSLNSNNYYSGFSKKNIRWINIGLDFILKVIFRIWMFRDDIKHLILNDSWWNISRFIVVFLLKLSQFFFFSFKNIGLEFSLKMIFRRWIFRGDSKHFIFNLLWV